MSSVLTNATLVELNPPRLRRADLVFDDHGIVAVGGPRPDGAQLIDCAGKWVLPGFACAHTHLYSALARGMPPPASAPRSFLEILERVWWKLDRALDAEAVELSALIGALEAARSGCTALVDHHASPGAIDGSLDVVGEAIGRVGLRGVLCYEVSDRGGADEARAGLRENERFLRRVAAGELPWLRGMVGAHAAFTLSDETGDAVAGLARRFDVGVHLHLAEDTIDQRKDNGSTVDWLFARGMIGPRSLLAHAVHVSDPEATRLRHAGAWVVHNARSNANNRVGYAHPSRFGEQLLLGSDGIDGDMRREAQAAFFGAREHGDGHDPIAALERTRSFVAERFGVPTGLGPGALADLIVLDYAAPTPVDERNLHSHLLFGFAHARVEHVIVGGRWVLRDGISAQLDEASLYARARAVATRLWSRL